MDGTTKIELRTKRLDTNGNCEFGVNGIYYMFQVGIGYFYDLVEGKFYGNEGSGSFIRGEKVPSRPLFDSEVLGVSAAKSVGRGLMILFYRGRASCGNERFFRHDVGW